MGWGNKSSCPVPNTCPKINEIIGRLDSAIEELTNCKGIMEELREANQNLREGGTKMEEERDEMEDEKSGLETSKNELIDQLLDAISERDSKIEQLEQELELE